MTYLQSDFRRGDLVELHDSSECTIDSANHPNVLYIVVSHPSKKKPYSIPISQIKSIISTPLPLEIGDQIIDEDNQIGEILSCSAKSIKKENTITSHNLEEGLPTLKKISSKKQTTISRGGKREGAGRKATGNPPKKRKAIQLDQELASTLPDLKMLAQLLEEFRPIAESGTLRSQKLADFYKKLDSLPFIV